MDLRIGILLIVGMLAVAAVVPMAESDADDAVFSYKSQLDDNGLLVYNEVAKATSIEDAKRSFTVVFKDTTIFDEETKATSYAESTVQNALAAEYLTDPMIPYLWNYPVDPVEVEVDVKELFTTDGETYYAAESVTFELQVPEGITEASMTELDDALKSFSTSKKNDYEKVQDKGAVNR